MGSVKYSVNIACVRYVKYKSGAPKNLLKKGGRWRVLNDYGGWDNLAEEPKILADSPSLYCMAPEMHEALQAVHKECGDSLVASKQIEEILNTIKAGEKWII